MSTKYTEDHEWVRLEGDVAVCGISAYASEQLGDVVYVELPTVGRAFAKGAEMAVVESAKSASDVYAPISGEVVAVNAALTQDDEDARNAALALIGTDPEGEGWFVKIKPANSAEIDALMDADAYKAHVG
jgi:glycine cleavage system H protein